MAKLQPGINDLQTTHPELIQEWDFEKNTIKPTEIIFGSGKRVWFLCLNHKHSYSTRLFDKINKKIQCPICTGHRVLIGFNDLQTTHPELLNEWDFKKNTIKPTEVSYGSHKKIWWKCKLNHSWIMSPNNRTSMPNQGCPYCSGRRILIGFNDLATTHQELCEEWDYEKNKIKPTEVTHGSNKKVWWLCKTHKHSFISSIGNRKSGRKCPICCAYGSAKIILSGFNDLQTTHPILCEELIDEIYNSTQLSSGSDKKVKWKCKKCNYIWKASISSRAGKGKNGCPKCNSSKGEINICQILDKYNINYNKEKTFDGCVDKRKLKFDFYLLEYNLCIEYQGLQHYPEKYKKSKFYSYSTIHNEESLKNLQKRDQIKRDFCLKENIKLIEIPYWDKNRIEEILIKELDIPLIS
jgi:hypothetical protein